ncbi:hypothetical protein [Actinoplanes sp. NPDC049316]|uniref:hypothetical protein n=1 Tax=Actinoplanes sp. NPDC049316 TaxID=3154727 RepID=UPI00341E8353
MRRTRSAGAAVGLILLVVPLSGGCGGGDEPFPLNLPCQALSEKEVGEQTGVAVTGRSSRVIDPTVYVCEWTAAGGSDYLVRLRTQNSTAMVTLDATLYGHSELPSLGEGGSQALSMDGAIRTVEAVRHGQSLSLQCRLEGTDWADDGCVKLAKLVAARMQD